MPFIGVVTEDGKKLILDYPDQFKTFYSQFAGDEVEVTVRKRRSKRSLKQNAYFHAAIAPLAEDLGYTTEELKLDLLGNKFGWKELADGNKVPLRLHTSELNTKDFADLMDYSIQIAAERGILILDPSQHQSKRRSRAM